MYEKMRAALGKLSAMAKMYTPADVQAVLLEYGAELDRLRADIVEMRSKIENKE